MKCIACGREGHCSSSCPQQLWKWAAPVPAAVPPVAAAPRRIPGAGMLITDSHDRTSEAWVHLR